MTALELANRMSELADIDGLADVFVYVDGDRYRVTAAHDDGEEFKLHTEKC